MTDINSDNRNVRNDEIDLLDLFTKLGRSLNKWIHSIFRAFLVSIVFLLRRWLPLTFVIVAGLAVSYFLKSINESYFTSDLQIRNNLAELDKKTHYDASGTTADMISKINKLHLFCAENNSNALSRSLALNPEAIRNINDINAFWIIDLNRDGTPDNVDYKATHNIYDTLNIRMQNIFDIRIRINSSFDLNLIRDGIIQYIENDSSYHQMNKVRLRQNQDLLLRVNYDIKQLDSLQKVKYFEETRNLKPGPSGQIVFMQERNTQLVYNEIHKLYEKKQLLEKERDLHKRIVEITSDFSIPTRRENGLLFYVKKTVPAFFLIALFFMIIHANRKNLSDIYNKY